MNKLSLQSLGKPLIIIFLVLLLNQISLMGQVQQFFDQKDSSLVKEIEVHYTSDSGWINVALTNDSSILVIKYNHCGDLQFYNKFRVDTFDINELNTSITRINNKDSIYLTAILHSPNFEGIYCLSIYGSTGNYQYPKIVYLPELHQYHNPIAVSKDDDRVLTFNASDSTGSSTGYMIQMDKFFTFKSSLRFLNSQNIHSIVSLSNDNYAVSSSDRVLNIFNRNLQLQSSYLLDSNITHFDHNLLTNQDSIILLVDYKSSQKLFGLLKFNFVNNNFRNLGKLIPYTSNLRPKLIRYHSNEIGMNNFAVIHIFHADSINLLSVSRFTNDVTRPLSLFYFLKKYTPLSYGIDYLPYEDNFINGGSLIDSSRYFSMKLNKDAVFNKCEMRSTLNYREWKSLQQDTFDQNKFEAYAQPLNNSTIKQNNINFSLSRKCKYYDFPDTTNMIPYCNGTRDSIINVSAMSIDPISMMNPFIKYKWSNSSTQASIQVNYPYDEVNVEISYCSELAKQVFKFIPKDCSPAVEFANVFVPADPDPINKLYGIHIKESYKVKKIEWSIYNRWGAKVFSSNRLDEEWDGTYHSNPAYADTYIVVVKILDIYDMAKDYSAMFTLVR